MLYELSDHAQVEVNGWDSAATRDSPGRKSDTHRNIARYESGQGYSEQIHMHCRSSRGLNAKLTKVW